MAPLGKTIEQKLRTTLTGDTTLGVFGEFIAFSESAWDYVAIPAVSLMLIYTLSISRSTVLSFMSTKS